MERSSSSRIAFITMSSCARAGPATAKKESRRNAAKIRISISPIFRGSGQYGSARLRLLFLLHFDLRDQDARRHGGDGDASRLCTANAIEHRDVVVGGFDLTKCREWCADQVYAANELLAPVREYAIDHQRHHIECVGRHSPGKGEPTGNILKVEPIGQAPLLDFGDEERLEVWLHGGRRYIDDQVGLPRDRTQTR